MPPGNRLEQSEEAEASGAARFQLGRMGQPTEPSSRVCTAAGIPSNSTPAEVKYYREKTETEGAEILTKLRLDCLPGVRTKLRDIAPHWRLLSSHQTNRINTRLLHIPQLED
ncbi:hypothetical protein Y1Q_0005989 [Alligator mississippiensis]|uniref:Uncharacterized protein n=1 Tax=Alligator mississippiensis TaxID=8496 RepID=A0A151N3I0_ALLMI|nr:hypothetical protein Y1Q_0005989 [Alligator mississippiensis]